MSWEMAEVYGSITDRILINLARHFPYYKPGQPVPASAFEYQARMLAQMGQVSAETMRIIKSGLDGVDKALQNTLEQAIIDAVSKSEPELIDAVKRGIFKPAGIPVVAPNQMRAFQTYYKQAADKLNLVNTVMLESTQQAYQNTVSDIVSRIRATQTALDVGAGETITGVSSWNQAMTHAIARMKQNGITGFIDHADHRWSAEAYAAMDIRTTVFNTGRAAVWETNENFGNDLYQVSYHNGARPLCYPYQNKVVSSTDNVRTVTDLDGNEIVVIAQSATSYGQPAGLFGINCKHYPNPFIPGVSIIRGEPQDEKTNARVYEESQHQRALERKIREEKRDLLMLKEQGAPDDIIKAQRAKIRKTDDDIDAFCEQTGRARRQNREGVYTKREFPAANTYDVATFVDQQKAIIESYYKNGGAQQGYTFGQMTPKTSTPPTTPAPVKPVPQNVVSQATQTTPPVVQSQSTEKSQLIKRLEGSTVATREVKALPTQLTEQEIIERVGGSDKTRGSCASVAWTYAGNKNGLDVLDFRDGESRILFSNRSTSFMVSKLDGVSGWIVEENNDFKAVHELYKNMTEGHEYYIATGGHASIIRKNGGGYQYLELQDVTERNGWRELNDTMLRFRFGCKRSHSTYGTKFKLGNVLIDIATLKGNKDFETMLTYINTAAGSQRKGIGGGIK
jgi:hypothetical protein